MRKTVALIIALLLVLATVLVFVCCRNTDIEKDDVNNDTVTSNTPVDNKEENNAENDVVNNDDTTEDTTVAEDEVVSDTVTTTEEEANVPEQSEEDSAPVEEDITTPENKKDNAIDDIVTDNADITETDTEASDTVDAIPEEKPTHTHSYKETVVAPTCTDPGHTVLTCDCGDSYVDFVKPELGHDYKKTVVAPTTESEGFTEFDCTRCTHSYKDNYVDKLPKPTTPDDSNSDGKPNADASSDWVNTGGKPESGKEYSIGNAGSLPEIPGKTRPTLDKNLSYSENLSALNGYIGGIYNVRMFADGLSLNDLEEGRFAKIVVDSGRYGIEVFQWRKSYDSDSATNSEINAVMEAMYFLCGDRDVAYALWSWQDAMSINRTAWAEDFGFTVVEWDENDEKIISMNNIKIEIDWDGVGQTFYFN